MKIAIITPEYPPYISGGIGSYNYELVSKLTEKNLNVTVITPSILRNEIKTFNAFHKCYYLKTPSLRPLYFYFQLYNRERIRKIIERDEPDILQLNVDSYILLKALKGFLKKIKLVLVFHGSPSPFNRQWDSLKHLDVPDTAWTMSLLTYSTIERAIGDDVFEYIDVAIHVSKHVMYYNLLCNEKLRSVRNVVIYPGVDVTQYVKYLNTTRKYSTTKNFRNFVFGARLMRYKGIVQLLRAFSLASEKNRRIALHIFGDGPLERYVLKFINSSKYAHRILYYDKVPRELFLKYLTAGDILVHPSFYESFGMVVIEAVLLNKPVIAHKAPWSEELVKAFDIGIAIDVSNEEEFSETLLTMANDNNYAKMLRKLQDRRIELLRIFSSETMARNYVELYYKLV